MSNDNIYDDVSGWTTGLVRVLAPKARLSMTPSDHWGRVPLPVEFELHSLDKDGEIDEKSVGQSAVLDITGPLTIVPIGRISTRRETDDVPEFDWDPIALILSREGTYRATLTVSGGSAEDVSDTITITVGPPKADGSDNLIIRVLEISVAEDTRDSVFDKKGDMV